MKRNYVSVVALALCTAMLAGACGQQKEESIYTGDKTEEPAYQKNLDEISPSAYAEADGLELEPGTYISVIGRGSGTAYWNQVKAGVEQAASDLNTSLGYSGEDKIKVLYSAPSENDNIDEQVNILDEELARYPDVIAISSIDESACSVQFDLAIENGIPIVAFDSGNSYNGIQCTARTDNKAAGKTGAQKFCETIGDQGEVILFVHDSVSATAKNREAGITEEIKENHPDVSVVETIYMDQFDELKKEIAAEQIGMTKDELAEAEAGNVKDDVADSSDKKAEEAQTKKTEDAASEKSDEQTADTSASDAEKKDQTDTTTQDMSITEKMQQVNDAAVKMSDEDVLTYYMEKHPDLKGLLATNETTTQLGVSALKKMENADEIKMVGFDAGKTQVEALKNGDIDGLIVQNPFGMGYASVIASARTVLEIGNEAVVDTGYVWATAENMEEDDVKPLLYE